MAPLGYFKHGGNIQLAHLCDNGGGGNYDGGSGGDGGDDGGGSGSGEFHKCQLSRWCSSCLYLQLRIQLNKCC